MKGLFTVYSEPRHTRLCVYADLPGEAKLATLLSTLANMTGTTVSQHISVGVDGKVVDPNVPIADLHIHEGSWITLQHSTNPPIATYAALPILLCMEAVGAVCACCTPMLTPDLTCA